MIPPAVCSSRRCSNGSYHTDPRDTDVRGYLRFLYTYTDAHAVKLGWSHIWFPTKPSKRAKQLPLQAAVRMYDVVVRAWPREGSWESGITAKPVNRQILISPRFFWSNRAGSNSDLVMDGVIGFIAFPHAAETAETVATVSRMNARSSFCLGFPGSRWPPKRVARNNLLQ